ncbi:MAG: dTDP-4-amino-4,6-dideoxygalactose transaminase [Bacteroidota bacterium]
MNKIPFNIPLVTGAEQKYLEEVIKNKKFSGDGPFTKKCQGFLEDLHQVKKVLLTPSCTHALEMCALLLDLKEGDEVIMPSYTFVSAANSMVLRGVKLVFVDVRPDNMNINENLIEEAITSKTKAIMVMHYGGVACEMNKIMDISQQYDIPIIEDAAQAIGCTYFGKALGSFGVLAALSFHETKNIHCGEGGALLINDQKYIERAEIIREKGTNRSKFFRGEVDKYTWVDLGSSYLNNELSAAFLLAQLESIHSVHKKRLSVWNQYRNGLQKLQEAGKIEWQEIPEGCVHNGHVFYIKVENGRLQEEVLDKLKENNIQAVFHYLSLHLAPFGKAISRFHGDDNYTTKDSDRLLRLPLYNDLKEKEQGHIIQNLIHLMSRENAS